MPRRWLLVIYFTPGRLNGISKRIHFSQNGFNLPEKWGNILSAQIMFC